MVLNCINGLCPPGKDQYVVGYKLIFDNVGMSDYQSVNHIQDWSGKYSQDATTWPVKNELLKTKSNLKPTNMSIRIFVQSFEYLIL